MIGVLHPVGPKSAGTYWARRALVLGVAALLVALVVSVLNLVGGRPDAVPATAPAATVTPTVAGTSAARSPSPVAEPTVTSATASRPTTERPDQSKERQVSTRPTPRPGPVVCRPADLRVTLTGRQRLKVRQAATFDVTLINGSRSTCRADLTSRNFELRIYSGRDRIWSSADCPRAVRPIAKQLVSEKSVTWQQRWNGRRSAPSCRTRSEIPRAGTYFATAELKGARPVQLRMILHG